ncbi:MAG: potassium transporter TrkA [Actinobacteria bacterium HGW-Actinobacteria-4]|nr:MAG: potassium transporter TrkA [Actinobacteria bacterium HGW-Actinobacteria-4]
MKRPSLQSRFRYWFDNLMSRGTGALVAVLAAVVLLIVIVDAIVILLLNVRLDGVEEDEQVLEVFWVNLLRTLSADDIAPDNGWGYRLAMLAITVAGVFIAATLIGIISGGFNDKVEQLRKGRSAVLESEHTLILGWNSKVVPLVQELSLANQSRRRPAIVVLAEREKVEMEDEIRAKVPDTLGTRVVCRTGDPLDQGDLLLVNPFGARSIIILGDEQHSDPDVRAIKTALALTHHPERPERKLHVVGQVRNSGNAEVATLVGKDEVSWIFATEKFGQITAQTSRQPGLSNVYTELLSFEGCEIYFSDQPSLYGKTYGEVLFAFAESAVLGLTHEGSVIMNPESSHVYAEGEKLVLFAEDDSSIAVSLPQLPDADALQPPVPHEQPPEHTLVLGFNKRVPNMLKELDEYVADGSTVTIVSEVPVVDLVELQHSTVSVVEGNTARRSTLLNLDATAFDHAIVVAYRDDMSVQDADAKTLVTLLQLREIVKEKGATLNVVSEMLDDRNRRLAEVTQTDDFIVSDHLISLMMAQISEHELLADVFDALFGAAGSEVYLRPASWYVKPGVEVDFYTVVAAALAQHETAVGFMCVASDVGDADVVINPHKATKRAFGPGDRIVVLAEN